MTCMDVRRRFGEPETAAEMVRSSRKARGGRLRMPAAVAVVLAVSASCGGGGGGDAGSVPSTTAAPAPPHHRDAASFRA